ncbi:MAG: metallophosphoesterase [Prevotellaceae bacterium]|jgi:predicted MPP superfamily phosphohydrolase|nr:metallophosphoesterase [Prevotellaceae bacterium]
MKNMLLFVLIFLLLFVAANAYILSRGWQLLEAAGAFRRVYLVASVLWAALFLAGMLLKRQLDSAAADMLWRVGAWWLVVLLYGFLASASFDFLRGICWISGKKLPEMIPHYPQLKWILFAVFSFALAAVMGAGYYNGTRAKVKTLELSVAKNIPGKQELHIVAVSDLHLGAVYTKRSLRRWVAQINALQPDIVFLLGDTFDDNPAPVIRENAGALLAQIHAPLGVFAVTGNHEMMGHPAKAMDYLSQHGVQPLLDTAVLVDNRFYVVGRLDRSAWGRKTIDSLTAPLDKALPVILLDHQPREWGDIARAGVDLSLSGHTHHGQLWPLNLLTERLYEQDWGYLQKDAMHFYTTCGLGAWGPPVRTAGRAEILQLRVRFEAGGDE